MADKFSGHALNNSPSKARFRFGSEERFTKPKESYCKAGYYKLPSINTNKAPGFGIGRRASLNNSLCKETAFF